MTSNKTITNESCRLQNILAEAGVASRRKSAELIKDGRVSVNGTVTLEPGLRVDPAKDRVTLDGKAISSAKTERVVIALNKPTGYICSADDGQGQTIYELLKGAPNIKALDIAGRLDRESEGLLILTNDGDLVNKLTHPRYGKNKNYLVTVFGRVGQYELKKLNTRLVIDDYTINPAKVTFSSYDAVRDETSLQFILNEGRNRQIRNMCRLVNLRISRLHRISINCLTVGELKPGEWCQLNKSEVKLLEQEKPAPGREHRQHSSQARR